ncbi:MAG: hypothetical protein OEW42_02785 [Acidimicrobiia bacterium]|nr:hypothetical protein [Acidimicrobiia bacterium]
MTPSWAPPETPADAAGPVARRRPAGVARMAPLATQPVPVPLRPLTMGEVLDGAFETIRIAPGLILGLSAAVVVPTQLVLTVLDRDLLDGNAARYLLARPWRYLVDSGSGEGDPQALAVWLVLVFGLTVPAVCAVGIGRVLSAWYAGSAIDARPAGVEMVRRTWVVLLTAPVRAIGSLLIGLPLVFLLLTGPVIGIERSGPLEALRRSWTLVQRRFGSALGFYLVSAFLVLVLTATLNLVPLLFGQLFLGDARWILMVTSSIAVSVGLTAFVAAGTCLLYLDSRVRVEGLDLELLLVDQWPETRS